MPKRRACLLFCLFLWSTASAQHPDDEYYPYAPFEERTPLLQTDSTLFYRAVQSPSDRYAAITDFNLPQVALKRRGQSYRMERIALGGLLVSYRYTSALYALGAQEAAYPGIGSSPDAPGLTGGVRSFGFSDAQPLQPYRASVGFADRNYLVAAKFSATHEFGKGWSGAAALDLRTGRDLHVEGVFTNAITASFRASKRFSDDHALSLLLIVPPSQKGTRLSSVEEAFTLTGDRLYNPSWGFQNGKVRNSRVRRDVVPLTAVNYVRPLSASTSLCASFGAELGTRKYSALGWYDARTPMPDNYRSMPSYTGDREAAQAWRDGDPRYTQIRWDELIAQNRMAGGHAVYALEDRVERLANLQLDASFTTTLDQRLTLRYGTYYRRSSSRNYKQMRDLLDAQYVTDIDQYLIDDDTYGNLLQNDLRDPDRTIRRGDRFAYDYTLTTREAGLRLRAEYRSDRLRADVNLSLSDAAVRRRGHYEKELFPGAQSYGLSRKMHFTPYVLKALAGWAFSPRNYLEASVMTAAVVPDAADLFFQPLYNNRTVDDPTTQKLFAAEINYRLTTPTVELHIAAFATASLNAAETRRYYDDMAGIYCDVAATGIGTMSLGVEAAADVRLSYRWRLSLAALGGRYRYIRDPRVTVLSDVDNAVVDMRATSHLGGCSVGGAPQLTACTGLNYFGPKGWGFRASAGYAGLRSVEPAFVRRTARIAHQAGITPEAFDAFTSQERLPDAFTLDAGAFKTFYFDRSNLSVTLTVRNLLGSRTTPYDGYESLRIRRIRSGAQTLWEPQATRYTYAYPRSFYLTVSYRF